MGSICCKPTQVESDIHQNKKSQNPLQKNPSTIKETLSKMISSESTPMESIARVLLIGDSGVGKSSLLNQFFFKEFHEGISPTTGFDFKLKVLELDNKQTLKLMIWDMTGKERLQYLTKSQYKEATGCLQFFDITNRESFSNVQTWVDKLRVEAPKECVVIIIGNKTDLAIKREVSIEEAKKFAGSLGFQYYETSAKEGTSVDNVFMRLITSMGGESNIEENSENKVIDAAENVDILSQYNKEKSAKLSNEWKNGN